MMASTRPSCFSSTLSACFCIPANGPTLGSMPIRLWIDPIFFNWRNWSRKAVAGEGAAGHFLGFFLVNILFRLFDQRENVAHAQNAGDDAVRMERFQRVVLFAHTDEVDGLAGDLADGKRRRERRRPFW